MTELEVLLIERACERLVIDSATHNDNRNWSALADLYADDGVVVRPNGQRLEGREAIESAYAAASPDRVTRHLCSNIRVQVESNETATAVTVVTIVSGTRTTDPDIPFGVTPNEHRVVGEFADHFVLTPHGWRIANRHTTIVMNA